MCQRLLLLGACLALSAGQAATTNVGSWTPIFKGIDLASGQWTSGSSAQQVLCLRVDLTDPDVVLYTTPHCTNSCALEVLAEYTSYFLEEHGLQVAVNGGNYASSSGPNDVPLGTADDVYGLVISKGMVVSPADTASYCADVLFTTNNQAIFIPTNYPGTNTAGIYTAVPGNRPLLIRGANVNASTPTDLDPRTAYGLSQDHRYLYLMTIDGRQTGWSDGADFHDTGEWLKRFGAYEGANLDGGGSTTMIMANCVGGAVRLNRSSFVAAYGRERNIANNFGVYAKPLTSPLLNLNVEPTASTALITWQTAVGATTRVQYGLTTNYESATTLDARLVKNHVVTLTGLTPGSNYYFRALSAGTGLQATQACQFSTVVSVVTTQLFGITNVWRYTSNILNGLNWQATNYNDSGWSQGPGLLYVENRNEVAPKNTALPPAYGQTIAPTYYFRTHFNFSGSTSGASLTLSNFVDDGAVFYLNGVEVYRLRVAAGTVTYTTAASAQTPGVVPISGDAITNAPDLFTLSGNTLTNLLQGDNVMAVEVKQYGSLSSGQADIVFGTALFKSTPVVARPTLNVWAEGGVGTLFWNSDAYTLQQGVLLGTNAIWTNAPGTATRSPYCVTNPATMFYRLKN
jgi:hypothetical protein